jgi:hypothetical protein
MFFHVLMAFAMAIVAAVCVCVAVHIWKNRTGNDALFAGAFMALSALSASGAFMSFVRSVQIAYGG